MDTAEKTASLKDLAQAVKSTVRDGAPYSPEFKHANGYMVTLRYQGRQMTTPFYMGRGLPDGPTAFDVLECLVSDASVEDMNFSDFCGDFGYDEDSRSAERVYKATVRQTEKLRRLLGADFDAFVSAYRG